MSTVNGKLLNFDNATSVISGALKYILPVPLDAQNELVYPIDLTDAKGGKHKKGDPIAPYGFSNIGDKGLRVYNGAEGIYQGATPYVRDNKTGATPRAVIIINGVTEEMATKLDALVNKLTNNNPESLTFDQYEVVEKYALEEFKLDNLYDSQVSFVQAKMQDPRTGFTAASAYGFKKRDDRDVCYAMRVEGPGELDIGDGSLPLPWGPKGAVILKQGDSPLRVIAKDIFEKDYRLKDGFQKVELSQVAPVAFKPGVSDVTLKGHTIDRGEGPSRP